jgi:hypothetical protein
MYTRGFLTYYTRSVQGLWSTPKSSYQHKVATDLLARCGNILYEDIAVPLILQQSMCFIHVGAPAHFTRDVKQFFDD